MYNFAVSTGVSIGIIISGVITLHNSWRVIYWVGATMIGILILLIIFTIPETAYNRSYEDTDDEDISKSKNPPRLSLSIILDDEEKALVARHYQENDALAEEGIANESSVIQRMEERIRRLEAVVLGNRQYSPLSTGFQPKNKSYWSTLSLFSGEIYTEDSVLKMFVRPFGLIILPPVLWATLVMATLIGFSVAISSACK